MHYKPQKVKKAFWVIKNNIMNKIIKIIAIACLPIALHAQDVLYNNGSLLHVNTGCVVQVNGHLTNTATSTLTNNGIVTVIGNTTNNQVMALPNSGLLEFKGTTAQTLNGTAAYFAKNVLLSNAAGVTLNTPLKVDGSFTFTNGILTAATSSNAVVFTENGTVTGTSDASHVNGYVVKEGTGAFTYPVGDGTKYQQCNVNLTANATGMQVKYNATDADMGTFTSAGTEATLLIAYNSLEHWDIAPLTTATGTVTMFWDAYKNGGIVNVTDLKVAHKVGTNWLNEGTTGTGTIGSGSVTSNAISSWSPFTLGSIINSTLPLRWLNINGHLNVLKQAYINWQVQENNVDQYIVEKSINGISFSPLANINSRGNGTNNYSFTDANVLQSIAYFRIKQVDKNGSVFYSTIIKLSNVDNDVLSIYPNPVKDVFTLKAYQSLLNTNATIVNANGAIVKQIKITNLQQQINIAPLAKGIYLLKTANGASLKIIKP
jgi:hypothetical protein